MAASIQLSVMELSAPSAPPIVFDNGAWRLRGGFAGLREPSVDVPNCTARVGKQTEVLVADQTETAVQDLAQLVYTRPLQRGYVVDWETQRAVWQRVFGTVRRL